MTATATLDPNSTISPLNPQAFAKVKDRVVKVRVRLLLQHPFFGNLATRLKIVDATDRIPTAAVDGRNMFVNVNFVNKLNDDELMFLIAHEVMHCVFEHMLRRGDRRPDVWNMAGDYVINYLLERERIGQVIRQVDILLDSKYKDMTTEEVYDSLMKNAVTIKLPLDVHLDLTDGEGEDGEGEGEAIGKRLSEEERKALQDEIKNAVLQSAQAAGAGKTPAAIARLIKQFTQPKMNWKDLLRIQLESSLKNDYSFTRPSRKAWHTGAVLPGMLPAEEVDICVAIDTSGSISETMIRDFLSEVKGIMDNYDSWTIKVWCFDTSIHAEADFNSDNGAYDILDYEPGGGGGTDFEANWEYMKANDITPKQLVVFTDGYPCGGWGDKDYCDTLWIINSHEDIEAPFGVTAFYDHKA